jgi:hypothetical protein
LSDQFARGESDGCGTRRRWGVFGGGGVVAWDFPLTLSRAGVDVIVLVRADVVVDVPPVGKFASESRSVDVVGGRADKGGAGGVVLRGGAGFVKAGAFRDLFEGELGGTLALAVVVFEVLWTWQSLSAPPSWGGMRGEG